MINGDLSMIIFTKFSCRFFFMRISGTEEKLQQADVFTPVTNPKDGTVYVQLFYKTVVKVL